MDVSESVLAEIARQFGPAEADELRARLALTDLPFIDSARQAARIHFAILLLAQGDARRASDAIDLAATDWRDVLVAAGLANDNWFEILAARGLTLP